jgi:hypothetical protein
MRSNSATAFLADLMLMRQVSEIVFAAAQQLPSPARRQICASTRNATGESPASSMDEWINIGDGIAGLKRIAPERAQV